MAISKLVTCFCPLCGRRKVKRRFVNQLLSPVNKKIIEYFLIASDFNEISNYNLGKTLIFLSFSFPVPEKARLRQIKTRARYSVLMILDSFHRSEFRLFSPPSLQFFNYFNPTSAREKEKKERKEGRMERKNWK